jgi:hypothetical protein
MHGEGIQLKCIVCSCISLCLIDWQTGSFQETKDYISRSGKFAKIN